MLRVFRYRRAKATVSKNNAGAQEYSKARDDLKVAIGLDPNESVIEELYTRVKEEVEKYERDKKGSSFNKSQKDKIDPIIEEIKPNVSTEKEKKNKEGAHNQKQQETHKNLNKKSDKNQTKQEKVNLSKEPEEVKIDTQSTASDASTGQDTKGKYNGKIESDNDVWKMLHGDVDPNSQTFSYELSFEINPNAKVPKEIQEFGR